MRFVQVACLPTGRGARMRTLHMFIPQGASSSSPGLDSQRLDYPGIMERKRNNPQGVTKKW
jgi:hypothetical protein